MQQDMKYLQDLAKTEAEITAWSLVVLLLAYVSTVK